MVYGKNLKKVTVITRFCFFLSVIVIAVELYYMILQKVGMDKRQEMINMYDVIQWLQ